MAWLSLLVNDAFLFRPLCSYVGGTKPAVRAVGALVKRIWQHPLARGIDINGKDTIQTHRLLLQSKRLLYQQYLRWYREGLPAFQETQDLDGAVVEIGSGASFLEEVIPHLIKTDVVPNAYASRVMDAMKLDFGDETLRCIFLFGVLHHIPFPEKFLHEAERCLMPGGRLVMVEPSNNFLQRILARFLDHYEYYDDTIPDWANGGAGRMDHANLALPWVIFIRDRDRFDRKFPSLKIQAIRYHTLLSYIVTGGMTYRSFLPSFAAPLIEGIENLARPFMEKLGTAMTIDIAKRSES